MIKKDLINAISGRTDIDPLHCERFLEATLKVIMKAVESGEAVTLRGFGTFKPVLRKAKKGRIVKQNLLIDIPETIKPVFVPSPKFKARCNG